MGANLLGIKILRNHTGFIDLFEFNSNPILANTVYDIRDDLRLVGNLTGNSVAVMLTNVGTGSVITLATWIAGLRGDESISAWIYIPNNIMITGAELAGIVEATKAELISTQRNDQRLYEIFSKAYETDYIPRPQYPTKGQGYAYRYYGVDTSYTLPELLDNLQQPDYTNFKHIIMLDTSDNLTFTNGVDLTHNRVLARCLLPVPSPVEGFVAYIDDNPVTAPRYFTECESVTVYWKRDGFKTIQLPFYVAKGMGYRLPERTEMMMLCPYESIVVRGESGEVVKNYDLKVFGHPLLPNSRMAIPIGSIHQAPIEVTANGYETYSNNHDLSYGCPVISLKKGYINYRLTLQIKNSPISLDYKSTIPLAKSPIPGYVAKQRLQPNAENILKYKPITFGMRVRRFILSLIFIAAGATAGYFGGIYYMLNYAAEPIGMTQFTDSTFVYDSLASRDSNALMQDDKPSDSTSVASKIIQKK